MPKTSAIFGTLRYTSAMYNCRAEDHRCGQRHAQPREDIAALGIEGLVSTVTEVSRQDHRSMACDSFLHSPVGIYQCGNAVVGCAQQVAVILNRPEARHFQMLKSCG